MTPDLKDPNCEVWKELEGKYSSGDCGNACKSYNKCGFAHIQKIGLQTCFLMKKPQDGARCRLKHAPSRIIFNCRSSSLIQPQGTAQPTPPPTPIVECIGENRVVPVADNDDCSIIETFPDIGEEGCVSRCQSNPQCLFASWNATWDTRTTNECTLWKGDKCSFMEKKSFKTYRCKGANFVNSPTMKPITCTRVNYTMPTNTSSQNCTEIKRQESFIAEHGKEKCALACQNDPECLFAHVTTKMYLGKRVCVLMKGVCASKETQYRTTYLCNGGTLEPT